MKSGIIKKALWEVLISQKVAVWLLGLEIAALLAGSVFMVQNREVTAAMSGGAPLFIWLIRGPVALTCWLWAAIFFLALLAVNTVCCSIESVRRKKGGLLTLLAPQVIHAGFLMILIAHLMSTLGASKISGQLPEGAQARLPSGYDLLLTNAQAGAIPQAEVGLLFGGIVLKRGVLSPNHPLFFKGYGYYLQGLTTDPFPAAFIEVSREPGAPWALFGAVLFTAGTVLLVALRSKD